LRQNFHGKKKQAMRTKDTPMKRPACLAGQLAFMPVEVAGFDGAMILSGGNLRRRSNQLMFT
jgi:hypothetical protein